MRGKPTNQKESFMSDRVEFALHDEESVPEAARTQFTQAQQAFGFVPNLYRVMAEAPPLLEAYKTIGGLFDQTSFSPVERQVVLLAVSRVNGCEYCVAAHSGIARMQGAADAVVQAIRDGRPIPDEKLEALRRFAEAVVIKRGRPDEEDLQAFLAAGYTKANVLEVVLGVGMKTLSNFTNHLADTPLDDAFKPLAWKQVG